MLVFLVRHAHADPGEPDEARALSARGRDEARTLAERIARQPSPPRIVFSSPLVRARQTAQEIGRATGSEVRVDERLAPGTTLDRLRQAVVGVEGPVAAVAHQPDCSEIAVALTGRDPGFPPAGVVELELDS